MTDFRDSTAWAIIRFIAMVLFVIFKVCFTIIVALIGGSMRGAFRTSTSGRSPRGD